MSKFFNDIFSTAISIILYSLIVVVLLVPVGYGFTVGAKLAGGL